MRFYREHWPDYLHVELDGPQRGKIGEKKKKRKKKRTNWKFLQRRTSSSVWGQAEDPSGGKGKKKKKRERTQRSIE